MARKDALLSLRAILVRRRDALRSALNGDLTLLKELRSESPGDVIDAAVDTAQDEISSQLAVVEARELGSIENALERMSSGAYGSCEICSGKIPLARLQAFARPPLARHQVCFSFCFCLLRQWLAAAPCWVDSACWL